MVKLIRRRRERRQRRLKRGQAIGLERGLAQGDDGGQVERYCLENYRFQLFFTQLVTTGGHTAQDREGYIYPRNRRPQTWVAVIFKR